MERAAQIQYLLKIKGKRQQDVAELLGVNKATVSQVVNGKRRSKRIEKALARMVGVRHEVLFGEAVAA